MLRSRSAQSLTLRFLALPALFLLVGSGCFGPGDNVVYGEIGFAEVVNPSLDPLDASDRVGLEFFQDGNGATKVMSELDWSSLIRGSDHVYGKLRKSRCLYVSNVGHPILTYDAILRDLVVTASDTKIPRSTNITEISLLGRRLTHPESRKALEVDEIPAEVWTNPRLVGDTIGLEAFTDGDAAGDPFDGCGVLDRGSQGFIEVDENLCTDLDNLSVLPFATIRCALNAATTDVSYRIKPQSLVAGDRKVRLEDFEVTNRAVMADPKDLEPLFKPVNGMRVIARPLEFVGVVVENDPGVCGSQIPADIPCREETVLDEMGQPRVPKARWLWRWATATLDASGAFLTLAPGQAGPAGSRWEENFDPNLFVSAVRIFTLDGMEAGQPMLRYVAPHQLLLDLEGDRLRDFDVLQEGEEEAREFDPVREGFLVTPTYRHADIQSPDPLRIPEKLEWGVEFRVVPDLQGFYELPTLYPGAFNDPVDPDLPLYLEFDVQDMGTGTTSSGLSVAVTPPFRDLGDVRLSQSNGVERAFTVVNLGLGTSVVTDIRMAGRDAADFDVALTQAGGLPLKLGPGESFDMDLTFHARSFGIKLADVQIDIEAGPHARTIAPRVVARGVDVIPILGPETLVLGDTRCATDPPPGERNLLLSNGGHLDLELADIVFEGLDAAYFEVWYEQPGSRSYVPVPPGLLLRPGDSEIFQIRYRPPFQGPGTVEHLARVRFLTNGTDPATVLHGWYERPSYGCP